MQQQLEKELILPNVTVQLSTVSWEGVGERPRYQTYSLFQRLSDNHAPLRIGNLSAPAVLPRVRSVGFLPAGSAIRLFPIEKPLRVLYCFYDAEFVETTTEIPRQQWEKYTSNLVALRNQRLEIMMQEINAELDQPGFAHGTLIETVTTLMLVELARYARQLERKPRTRGDGVPLAPAKLRCIQERIRHSLEQGYPSLGELADLCGTSQSHLARAFKAATGWQIHRYIAEERLKTAKTLLAQGDCSCEQVSTRLGFKSPAYFSTAFRRMTGKTPSQFRKLALSGRDVQPR